ncbi:MAG: CRTAC1 family protein, partial [Gemmataceae bacterium]|nr:CRTAC1 family protein [Gemmataceae bacterium]
EDEVVFGNAFFKNLGGGKFVDITETADLETFWPWGIAPGDFDNDGYLDIFIPAGMGYPFGYWPNSLMMNNGNETFRDRASEFGIEPPPGGIYQADKIGGQNATRSSRAAAVADFDRDGRLDIIVNNFNGNPYYFHNIGKARNFLALRLTGTKSNRDAIGAVVRVHTGGQVLTRQVHTACGYLAQSSRVLHFGLGDNIKIDRVEIRWPSGRRQEWTPPAINALHDIVEPKDG